jgi:hypothetical protein
MKQKVLITIEPAKETRSFSDFMEAVLDFEEDKEENKNKEDEKRTDS